MRFRLRDYAEGTAWCVQSRRKSPPDPLAGSGECWFRGGSLGGVNLNAR